MHATRAVMNRPNGRMRDWKKHENKRANKRMQKNQNSIASDKLSQSYTPLMRIKVGNDEYSKWTQVNEIEWIND